MANLRTYQLILILLFWKKIDKVYLYLIYKSFQYCFLLLRNNAFKTSLYLIRKTLYYWRCDMYYLCIKIQRSKTVLKISSKMLSLTLWCDHREIFHRQKEKFMTLVKFGLM